MTSHLATTETPFFLVPGRDPNLPLQQLLEPMQQVLGDPESGHLDLKSHSLAFAIAKKTLDENRFKHAQKTTNCTPPNFKIGDGVYFKNKQPGKWHLKWRSSYRIVCIECKGYYLYIENQATEKRDPAMSRMLCTNHQLSCGMLIQNLAELENLLMIQQISPLSP